MGEVTRTVESIMSGTLLYQQSDSSVSEVLDIIHRNNADAILVLHNGLPHGLITEKEIMRAIAITKDKFMSLTALDIMKAPLITMDGEKTIQEAKNTMVTANVEKIPVTKENEIIGLVTNKDVLNYLF
jgi:CBS domain-containing protein